MTRLLLSLLSAVALFAALPARAAEPPVLPTGVVNFDDLGAAQRLSAVADSYQGFSWGDGLVTWSDSLHPSMYTTFQAAAGTSIARADNSAFYFDGADFFLRAGAGTNDIYLFLYDPSGALVYDGFSEKYGRNHIVDTNRSQTFGAITGIDSAGNASYYSGLVSRVAFGWDGNGIARIGNANDFGMDNFRYRASALAPAALADVSAVPEPQSYAMLLAGMGLVATMTRRRRANQT